MIVVLCFSRIIWPSAGGACWTRIVWKRRYSRPSEEHPRFQGGAPRCDARVGHVLRTTSTEIGVESVFREDELRIDVMPLWLLSATWPIGGRCASATRRLSSPR